VSLIYIGLQAYDIINSVLCLLFFVNFLHSDPMRFGFRLTRGSAVRKEDRMAWRSHAQSRPSPLKVIQGHHNVLAPYDTN